MVRDSQTRTSAQPTLVLDISKQKFSTAPAFIAPNYWFFSTHPNLPSQLDTHQIHRATELQKESFFPGADHSLLLKTFSRSDNLALWLDAHRSDELYNNLKSSGVQLCGLVPRALALLAGFAPDGPAALLDQDEETATIVAWDGANLSHWEQTRLTDLKQNTFAVEWHNTVDNIRQQFDEMLEVTSEATWSSAAVSVPSHLLFTPPARLQFNKAQQKSKRRRVVIGLLLLTTVGLITPFIEAMRISFELQQTLSGLKEDTQQLTNARAHTVEIENHYSPILRMPSANLRTIFLSLNQLIPTDTRLTHFKFEKGLIEMEGIGPNPEQLLFSLENHSEFENVRLSRAVQGERSKSDLSRFGIQLQLRGYDLNSYLAEFFPEDPR